jgi:hypothetical protein
MSIDLLLTDAGSLAPLLRALDGESAAHGPEPAVREPSGLAVPGHSDNLQAEKWGVVIPDTAAGKKRLGWLRSLCELRSRQCGLPSAGDVPVLPVAPGMDRQGARQWRADYENRHPSERPGYLLIAGDLHEVSHELQQELMVSASVGRLCFTTPDGDPDRAGYEAYCAKVRDAEERRDHWDEQPRLLFYASHDGTAATATGYYDLIRRAYADAQADPSLGLASIDLFGSADDHEWHAPGATPEAQARTLLHAATLPQPAVLLSLTHGAGERDRRAQRLRQGALVLAESIGKQRIEILDHEYFQQSFLPRGFWFFKACFSAGTPATSVYEHWLDALHDLGRYGGNPRDALKYLATGKTRPFIARVPQVALARPDGPLGILAHVDLAWTHGLQALDEEDPDTVRAEHGPYYEVLRMVASGHRFGPALASLSDKALALGSHLVTLYGDAEANRIEDSDERRLQRAWLWMRYLDLAGYILLGDPAAQLPIRAARDLVRADGASTEAGPAGPSPEQMEKLVLECLRQRQSPGQIAKNAGIHPGTLENWLRAYKNAGRQALAALATRTSGQKPEKS